ncbi:MAG TPA: macro domain-containing protein [Gammaproteobacteria bacterium]|nr:macro domain-containing protein [Gammaproteobacteria bacterium]
MNQEPGDVEIEIVRGDIARQAGIDAVVNAANAALLPGGGVAGAIHRAAGAGLAAECGPLAPIAPGEAVVTDAHDLPNRWVIHCLGPVYGRDEPAAGLLADCYRNALARAEEKGAVSIAFPAISTGAFGYPAQAAAEVCARAIREAVPSLENIRLVRFVLFDAAMKRIVERAFAARD